MSVMRARAGRAGLRAAVALAVLLSTGSAASQALDTVFLTNGGRLRGSVMVDEPTGVTVQLADGSTRKLRRDEVLRVEYAGGGAPATPAAPVQPAAPAQPAAPLQPAAPQQPAAPEGAPCGLNVGCPTGQYCGPSRTCISTTAVPEPTPPAYPTSYPAGDTGGRTTTKGIPALYIAGPILLGVAWAVTIAVTAAVASDRDKAKAVGFACIPVAGPWVIIADDDKGDYDAPLVVSGVAQGSGLIMTILGVAIRRRVPAYSFELTPGHTATVQPFVGPSSAGFAGAF